jgi:putative ABC transport system permease protein
MRLYRALLYLYPKSFRAEYGGEILSVISDRRSIAGPLGRVVLAAETVGDTVTNALRIHVEILLQDLRYTVRTLRRSPAFAITAILLTALGIGATTAALAMADHVLLRPLPFRDPDTLIRFQGNDRTSPGGWNDLSPGNYRDLVTRSTAIEAAVAYTARSANLVGVGSPVRLQGQAATGELFEVLGVQAGIGRVFTRDDQPDSAPDVIVVSHAAWRTYFNGDASVIGRSLRLNDRPHTVIGVMPEGFMFPDRATEFWSVLKLAPQNFEDRGDTYLFTVARLRADRSIEQADAEFDAIAMDLERQFPAENERLGVLTVGLRGFLGRSTRTLVMGVAAAALCLLLIASTNLASLLLSRSVSRLREIAVRAAIGAGRERLIRQMLTESLVIAILGGLLGIALAVATAPLLTRLVPTSLPLSESPSVDIRFLTVAVAMTLLTALAFGVFPARRAAAGADTAALRESSRVGTGSRTETLRSSLVVSQVALSVVLLVSVGLLGRALWRVSGTDTGFRSKGVLTLSTALPSPKYGVTARRNAFYQQVIRDIRALPGVQNAAYITGLPMVMRGRIWAVKPEMPFVAFDDDPAVSSRFVTPGFFETMSIPITEGRDISWADTANAPLVAVVSRSFAQQIWPGSSGIGRRFRVMNSNRTIVGVVGDIRVRGLEQSSEPQMYLSSQQVPDNAVMGYAPQELVVRTDAGPSGLLPSIRHIVQRADPEQPIANVRLFEDIVSDQIAPRAVQARVLGGFAGTAMLLAAIGLYGLLAFAIATRTREIGLRMALGATPGWIVGFVVRRGLILGAMGVVIGCAAAYGAGRWMDSLLAGISPHDPAIFSGAIGLTLTVALVGTLLPAIRASRVSPLEATRE